ncbi:hypothetical protein K9M59_00485 [Candidatus Gracilibacteria bacterium]|nr:hypothetical protein [Candidatus Gracilibacteria bacterium]MCF7819058.1 hypothetical protein [Candidatus Gracilibacteria bacterium]
MRYKKIFSLIFLTGLTVGCSQEEIDFWEKEVREAPVKVAVDTIEKLIRAESLFRDPDSQYVFSENDLVRLFQENEYEILVEDYYFFYCYEPKNKENSSESNFLVLAQSNYGDLLGRGTASFRKKTENLQNLALHQKTLETFEQVLEVENGACIRVPIVASSKNTHDDLHADTNTPQEPVSILSPEEKAEIEREVLAKLRAQAEEEGETFFPPEAEHGNIPRVNLR